MNALANIDLSANTDDWILNELLLEKIPAQLPIIFRIVKREETTRYFRSNAVNLCKVLVYAHTCMTKKYWLASYLRYKPINAVLECYRCFSHAMS
jgi:hypothetical protein